MSKQRLEGKTDVFYICVKSRINYKHTFEMLFELFEFGIYTIILSIKLIEIHHYGD